MQNARATFLPFAILIGLGVAYAVFFLTRPETDLNLHRYLWNPEQGFYLKQALWVQLLYDIPPIITRVVAIGGVLFILFYKKLQTRVRFTRAHAVFLLMCLALGPGLVVNTIFKDNWGRARPSQVVELGGTKQFTPPLVMSNQCEKNCSFVSGHASVGFFIAAFALLAGAKRTRVLIYSGAVVLGLLVGLSRMAMGGHFFSDVIYSGIFTLLTVHLCHYVVFVLWPRRSKN